MTPQDIGGDLGGTVWNPQDNNFRARTDAQRLEIGVPGDEYVPLLLRVLQDGAIGAGAQAAVADVSRIRKEICDRCDQVSRKILVEEQRAHARLGGRERDGANLAGCGESESRANVIG